MTILTPSNLETADYGAAGWNAVYSSNFQKINAKWKDITAIKHTDSQAEATFSDIDDIKNKQFFEYKPILELLADASIDLTSDIREITIKGDDHALVGLAWKHGFNAPTGGGSGVVSFTRTSDKVLTVTCVTTNPDFTGLEKFICIGDITTTSKADHHGTTRNITDATLTALTVDTISSNEITFVEDLPTNLNAVGAVLIAIPNINITSEIVIRNTQKVKFVGVCFTEKVENYGNAEFENCVFFDVSDYAFKNYGNTIFSKCCVVGCDHGIALLSSSNTDGPIDVFFTNPTNWNTNDDNIRGQHTERFSGVQIKDSASWINGSGSSFGFTHYGITQKGTSCITAISCNFIHTYHEAVFIIWPCSADVSYFWANCTTLQAILGYDNSVCICDAPTGTANGRVGNNGSKMIYAT